jgi:hypothetical protein
MPVLLDSKENTIQFYTLYTSYNHASDKNRAKIFYELLICAYKSGGLQLLEYVIDKEMKDDIQPKRILSAIIRDKVNNN